MYAAERIGLLNGYQVITPRPFYNEFLVRTPHDGARLQYELVERKLLGGVPLGADYADLSDALLLAFTEQNTRSEIDRLVEALRDAESPMTAAQIGKQACIDWEAKLHKEWMDGLLQKLVADRLIVKEGSRFALPQ